MFYHGSTYSWNLLLTVHDSSFMFLPGFYRWSIFDHHCWDVVTFAQHGFLTFCDFSQDLLMLVRHRTRAKRMGNVCYVISLDDAKQVAKEVVYCNCNISARKPMSFDSMPITAKAQGILEWLNDSRGVLLLETFVSSGVINTGYSDIHIICSHITDSHAKIEQIHRFAKELQPATRCKKNATVETCCVWRICRMLDRQRERLAHHRWRHMVNRNIEVSSEKHNKNTERRVERDELSGLNQWKTRATGWNHIIHIDSCWSILYTLHPWKHATTWDGPWWIHLWELYVGHIWAYHQWYRKRFQ